MWISSDEIIYSNVIENIESFLIVICPIFDLLGALILISWYVNKDHLDYLAKTMASKLILDFYLPW